MLLPAEVDAVLQKKGCKRNSVWAGGSVGGKVVFTLLAKVVAFYVWSTMEDVRGLSLKFVSKSTFWSLEERLEEVIHVFLCVLGNVRSSGW